MKLLVDIYRSTKKEGMYVFLENGKKPQDLPPELVKNFGKAELAMTLMLTPEKKLARANAEKVINALQKEGFYLQMPPKYEVSELAEKNSKLGSSPL